MEEMSVESSNHQNFLTTVYLKVSEDQRIELVQGLRRSYGFNWFKVSEDHTDSIGSRFPKIIRIQLVQGPRSCFSLTAA